MLPEVLVEFIITGTNPFSDEFTKAIGITPTKTWKLGESIQETALRRKNNGWCLSSEYHHDLDLQKYAKDILQVLLPKSEILSKYCTAFDLNCELSCAMYIVDETPVVNFDEETISALTSLNASLDIDIILTKK
jgi:hypothetical protein